MRIHLINLGCARNQVDGEIMRARLRRAGHQLIEEPAQAEAIVVNTCCFIEAAADESIDTILAAAQYKQEACCRRLIVTGCLPERYREKAAEVLPEVDLFLGTGAYDQIVRALSGDPALAPRCLLPDPDRILPQDADTPRDLTPGSSAYLKIAEGCDRHCTFCIIPRLRGRQKSRPLEAILGEARHLVAAGIQELVLVAQETTRYGADLDPPQSLSRLLEALSDLAPERWIRFLYGHPGSLSPDVLRTVAGRPNLCPYFDIPIQHISDRILKRMGRDYTARDVKRIVRMVRDQLPHAALRTTVIVGFPGETDADFSQLLDFVAEAEFDHLGAFMYSDADDLAAHRLQAHVATAVARKRLERLMHQQRVLSDRRLARYMDQVLPVLVESSPETGVYLGRTVFQAPEVDGLTYVRVSAHALPPAVGQFARVRITDTLEYDLVGEPA